MIIMSVQLIHHDHHVTLNIVVEGQSNRQFVWHDNHYNLLNKDQFARRA